MSVKINAAESIRGLACLAVVFSHLSLSFFPYLHHFDAKETTDLAWVYNLHHSPFGFLFSGDAAVFVFFVLSGYVLSYAILKDPTTVKDKIKSMLIKRYPRLMIPALVSCLIIWCALHFISIDSSLVGKWLQAFANQNFSFQHAVYEGTIGAFLFAESDVNWVLWTMTLELLGSFVVFFLLYIYQLNTKAFWFGSIVIILLSALWRGQGFCFGISCFIIGIYIYLYAKTLSHFTAIFMLILGLYFAGAHNTSSFYQWIHAVLGDYTYDYCNFFAGILIVYSILMSPLLSKALDRPIFVWLGRLSFSIYLLHLLILYLICIPLFNFLFRQGWGYTYAVICSAFVSFLLILVVAEWYSRYVDQGAIRISQKLAKRILQKNERI